MTKRIFIVHGWGGSPDGNWFPWLKKELSARGFEVYAPQLPDPDNPRIQNWVPKLAETVGIADENCYFVGHSMGVQTIARYLETLPEETKIGGAIFVAGFFKRLTGLENNQDEKDTNTHWLGTKPDFVKIRSHLSKSVAIFSDNDHYVPLDNQDDLRDQLGSEIIIEHTMGHLNENANVFKLPIVLEKLLEMMK